MKIPEVSRTTAAVRPAAVEPLPDVYNPLGAILEQNFSISLFAVPGSPTRKTFMSPLTFEPSESARCVEPTISKRIASLNISCPRICGAKEPINLS